MIIHVILLVFITIFGILVFRNKPYSKKKNRLFVIVSFFAIFLIQSLRNISVGWDTIDYVNAFHLVRHGLFSRSWELFFRLLLFITARISASHQLFLALCSLLILFGIGYFIVENIDEDQSAFWPVFLFIVLTQYFSSMNLLRQSLAISFSCNIYTVLRRGKTKKNIIIAIALTIVAFLFHRSSLVVVLLFIPFFITLNRKIIIIAFATSLSTYFLFPVILNLFFSFFPSYSGYMGGSFDRASASGYYVLIGFLELFMGILIFLFLNPRKEKNYNCYILLVIVVYSFALIVAQRRISLAIRLGYYFELFLILLIPEFVSKWKNAATRIYFKAGMYLFGWGYFIYSMTESNARGCVPYTFFWQ